MRHKTRVLCRRRGEQAPPGLRHKTIVCTVADNCALGVGGLAPLPQNHGFVSQAGWGHVCCVTQRTCLLCHTSDNVCCATQLTLSAVSHSRQCLLCDTADVSSVPHSRQCLFCRTAYMSAVSHSRVLLKKYLLSFGLTGIMYI